MSQRKNPELDAKHQAILRKMMQMSENKTCADCKGPSPRWASTNLGIFLCISCSGIHRKLGTHISQVRSVTLDTWTPAQIAHFTKFGNARAAQYFEACIPPNFQRPPHGDSTQMERFIRDKYENKRYITVENGGLGGEAVPSYRPSGSSYGGILGPRPSQALGTESYSRRGYDSANTTRSTGGFYNSYGGRFGSGSSKSSLTRRMGGLLGQTTSAPEIRRGNAMQRASTLKELLNMGFSAQHAARAVEAAQGDLQKAVDWVLEHNDEGNRNFTPSYASPSQQTPQRDLLDFNDPVPAPQAGVKPNASQQARPKAIDTELLMSTTPTGTTPSTAAAAAKNTHDLADFADFGAFESVLPATTKPSSGASNVFTNGSLSSTIQNIYKQSPPQRAQPFLNRMPHMTSLDQSRQVASPQSKPIRTTPSPKLMAQKAAEASKKILDTDLGLTFFTELANSQYALSSARTDSQLSHHPVSHRPTSSKPNGAEVPPPPPQQVEVSVPNMNSSHPPPPPPDSPPPDSPPPPAERPSEKANTYAVEPNPKDDLPPVNLNPEQDEKETSSSIEQAPSQEEEEEEDPFAALSMMAMKSAKTKSAKTNLAPHASLQSKTGVVSGSKEQEEGANGNAATVKPTKGIDLDELLG